VQPGAFTVNNPSTSDVVVIAEAIGAEPLDVVKSDSMLFANIEIHGGIGGINLFDTSNSTLDHIRVVPRPGALLASVIGGLMFFDPLQNNHIRNSYVTRNLDDALGMGADPPATVVSQPGPIAAAVELTGGLENVVAQRNVIRGTSHGVTIQNHSVPAMWRCRCWWGTPNHRIPSRLLCGEASATRAASRT
jgi:hypothetical protein